MHAHHSKNQTTYNLIKKILSNGEFRYILRSLVKKNKFPYIKKVTVIATVDSDLLENKEKKTNSSIILWFLYQTTFNKPQITGKNNGKYDNYLETNTN